MRSPTLATLEIARDCAMEGRLRERESILNQLVEVEHVRRTYVYSDTLDWRESVMRGYNWSWAATDRFDDGRSSHHVDALAYALTAMQKAAP